MDASKVFGVPLDQLMINERKKNPNAQVPAIIRQSIRLITRTGIDSEGVFRISGNKERVASLIETLNKGVDLDFVKEKLNPNDVASLFKQFLRELPDPVFTFALYDQWIKCHGIQEKQEQLKFMKELLGQLPKNNHAVLNLIVPFFYKIAMNSKVNKMDCGNISKTVGPNLLWKAGGGDSIDYLINSSKINDLVQIMIEEHAFLFEEPADEHAKFAVFDAKLFGHQRSIQCLVVPSDGKEVWTCDSNGTISIWNASTYEKVKEMESNQGRLFTMSRINDTQIWTGSQKTAKIWDTRSHDCIKEIEGFAYCMAKVGNNVWVGSESKIKVYNEQLELVKEIEVAKNVVMSLCHAGSFVWSGTTDRSIFIHVWNAQTGELKKEISEGHKKKVNAFTVVDDKVWSAGDDNMICVWDINTLALVRQLPGHQGAVYGVSGFGDFVWSCGWDTTIRIWDTQTFETACELKDYHSDCVSSVQAVRNSESGVVKAWTSSWDKSVCIFRVTHHKTQEDKERIAAALLRVSAHISAGDDASEKTLEEAEKKIDDLKKKNHELSERSKELQARRATLDEKKKALAERRAKLEVKKQELAQRRAQLQQKAASD